MISKETKAQLAAEYGKTPTDTGSPAVQVAILTYRIKELTEHLNNYNNCWNPLKIHQHPCKLKEA